MLRRSEPVEAHAKGVANSFSTCKSEFIWSRSITGTKFWPCNLHVSAEKRSSDEAMFFQSSTVQHQWACAHCSLSFLFLADTSGTWSGLYSFLSAWTSLAIQKVFSLTELQLTGCFLFFTQFSVNFRDCCQRQSQETSSFWDTQNTASDIDNHTTVKLTQILPHSDVWTTTKLLDHVCMLLCVDLLPGDVWLDICISKQVYLIKWPLSVFLLLIKVPGLALSWVLP